MPIRVDSSALRRRLRRLHQHELGAYSAKVINSALFESQAAVKATASATFEFAGAPTRNFLTGKGSFLVFKATPDRRIGTLYARTGAPGKGSTDSILADHQFGDRISARDREHLSFDGFLAVPVAAKRGPRGKIPPRELPWTKAGGRQGAFKRRARAFRAGRAILGQREGSEDGPNEVLFALVDQAKLRPVFQFFAVTEATVRKWLPIKARERFEGFVRGR